MFTVWCSDAHGYSQFFLRQNGQSLYSLSGILQKIDVHDGIIRSAPAKDLYSRMTGIKISLLMSVDDLSKGAFNHSVGMVVQVEDFRSSSSIWVLDSTQSDVQEVVRSTGRREGRARQQSLEEETRGGTNGTKAVDTCTVLYKWAVQVICTSTYMQRPSLKTLNHVQDSTVQLTPRSTLL